MHYYIVDPQNLKQKEFERVQNLLYSSLSEYRIAGEVVRTTGVRTVNQLVENALAHEAKTIIAVGSDETLHNVINAVAGREIVVGFIPLIKSELADMFGINDVLQSVKTLAFRRVESLDLGSINGYLFLSRLNFGDGSENFEIKFTVNDQFSASHQISSGLIINMRKGINPSDGLLEIMLLPKLSFWQNFVFKKKIQSGQYENLSQSSIIHAKKVEIQAPAGLNLKLDDKIIAKAPAIITVSPNSLRMIVSKDRKF